MKRKNVKHQLCIFLSILLFFCVAFSSCGVPYRKQEIVTCKLTYSASIEIALSPSEIDTGENLWKAGSWRYGNTKVKAACDYQFSTQKGWKIEYSSEHGVFIDRENKRCLELSPEDTEMLNAILDQYIDGYSDQSS